jgi:hypothetical protein
MNKKSNETRKLGETSTAWDALTQLLDTIRDESQSEEKRAEAVKRLGDYRKYPDLLPLLLPLLRDLLWTDARLLESHGSLWGKIPLAACDALSKFGGAEALEIWLDGGHVFRRDERAKAIGRLARNMPSDKLIELFDDPRVTRWLDGDRGSRMEYDDARVQLAEPLSKLESDKAYPRLALFLEFAREKAYSELSLLKILVAMYLLDPEQTASMARAQVLKQLEMNAIWFAIAMPLLREMSRRHGEIVREIARVVLERCVVVYPAANSEGRASIASGWDDLMKLEPVIEHPDSGFLDQACSFFEQAVRAEKSFAEAEIAFLEQNFQGPDNEVCETMEQSAEVQWGFSSALLSVNNRRIWRSASIPSAANDGCESGPKDGHQL